jgi:hypothetical protein
MSSTLWDVILHSLAKVNPTLQRNMTSPNPGQKGMPNKKANKVCYLLDSTFLFDLLFNTEDGGVSQLQQMLYPRDKTCYNRQYPA